MTIESSIENVDETTRKIKVVIPLERVQQEINTALNEAVSKAHLKGFRPGKAPRDVVEKTHGPRVRLEVANRLISTSLNDIIKENKLDVVGNPEIDMADYKPDQAIEYTASVAIYPRPEIKNYEKLKITINKQAVKEDDVEAVIVNMLKSKSTLNKLADDQPVKGGNVVDALISIEKNGQEESRPEPLVIEVGEGKIPKDLEDAFLGMQVGEVKKVPVPSNQQEGAADGKDHQEYYVIKLEKISERILPELNDEFVSTLQIEPKTLLELRMDIRKNLEKQAENNSQAELNAAILKEIAEANKFQVPQLMIDNEIYNLLTKSGQIKGDENDIKIEHYRSTLGEIAEQRVRTAIVVDRIAEQEKIELNEEEIQKELGQMAENYKVSKEEMMNYLVKNNLINGFIIEMRRSKTIDALVAKTDVQYNDIDKKA